MASDPAPDRRRLAAIVVTHNRLAQVRVTVDRLLRSSRVARLFVVDNASTDGTGDWLSGLEDPRVAVIALAGNSGGAGGFAAGMRAALDHADCDWLVLMDDDARPEPGALTAFAEADLAGWDAVAAAVRYPADRGGGICEMNRPSRNPFWERGGVGRTLRRGRDGYHIPVAFYDHEAGIQSIDVTSFVGFFVSVPAVERFGLPDAGLFLYGDDSLYTLGMRRGGGRIGFAPRIRFEHDCATFEAAGPAGRLRPLWKVYYYHRNLLMLYRIAAGPWFWPALGVVLPRWLWRLRAYRGDRARAAALLLRAIADGIRQRTAAPFAQVRAWAGSGVEDRPVMPPEQH